MHIKVESRSNGTLLTIEMTGKTCPDEVNACLHSAMFGHSADAFFSKVARVYLRRAIIMHMWNICTQTPYDYVDM